MDDITGPDVHVRVYTHTHSCGKGARSTRKSVRCVWEVYWRGGSVGGGDEGRGGTGIVCVGKLCIRSRCITFYP